MEIGKMFRGAISSAASTVGGFIGGKIAGPKGAMIGQELGSKVGGLFERKAGDSGEFEPISTMVQPASFGGKMGFFLKSFDYKWKNNRSDNKKDSEPDLGCRV